MGFTSTSAARRFFVLAEKDYKKGKVGAAALEALAGVGAIAFTILKQVNNN
jgi:hypothetical protein